ncbi:MAG: sigma factor-like helix-turn-helix DNA-binding protein, partial [Aristaeellaceae bacterium]
MFVKELTFAPVDDILFGGYKCLWDKLLFAPGGAEGEKGLNYEESLMVKAAWYYYFENMTQQAIADRLSISRMRVI